MNLLATQLASDPRATIRNDAAVRSNDNCVVYWMQRSQRSSDNAALNLAIKAGNTLGKPVVVFFGLRAGAYHVNSRHYHFMLPGLADVGLGLRRRGVGFVVEPYPEHDTK